MRRKIAQLKKGDLPLCKFYEPYHSVLRKKCDYTKLAFNKAAFNHLQRMKQTAAGYKIVYLTSTQVFSRESMLVIKKDFKDHRWIDESYSNPQTYRGYINPQINQKSGQKVDVWQRCMSLPYIECRAQRYSELKVSYVNEKRQSVSDQIAGFKAYVFQHAIDHINGKCVLDWDSCRGYMRVYTEAQDLFPKTAFVLRDYSMKIRQAIQKRKKTNQQIVLNDEQKKLQNRQQQVLRKVLQEEIHNFTQKYHKKS